MMELVPCCAMSDAMQISINLWSIRDHFGTLALASESLRKLKTLGFDAVELCHSPDMLSVETMANLCSESGIAVSGIHDISVIDHPELAVSRAKSAQCKYITFPYPGERDLTQVDVLKKLAMDLNEAGKILNENDLQLSYHNHDMEFAFCGETRALDYLAAHTSPQFVQFQFDIYWIKAAGLNPLDLCEKHSNRLAQLHLKDLKTNNSTQQIESCPIGLGSIHWGSILAAVPQAQITIEQEHFHRDPFDDFAQSINFLKKGAQ